MDGVVGLLVDGQLTVFWLLERNREGLWLAFVAQVGQRGAPSLTQSVIRASRSGSARAALMSCSRPGRTPEVHSGHPSGAETTWMFPP